MAWQSKTSLHMEQKKLQDETEFEKNRINVRLITDFQTELHTLGLNWERIEYSCVHKTGSEFSFDRSNAALDLINTNQGRVTSPWPIYSEILRCADDIELCTHNTIMQWKHQAWYNVQNRTRTSKSTKQWHLKWQIHINQRCTLDNTKALWQRVQQHTERRVHRV